MGCILTSILLHYYSTLLYYYTTIPAAVIICYYTSTLLHPRRTRRWSKVAPRPCEEASPSPTPAHLEEWGALAHTGAVAGCAPCAAPASPPEATLNTKVVRCSFQQGAATALGRRRCFPPRRRRRAAHGRPREGQRALRKGARRARARGRERILGSSRPLP